MLPKCRYKIAGGRCLLAALLMLAFCSARNHFADSEGNTKKTIILEGRVRRLPGHETNLVFATKSGKTFQLLRTPPAEALFLDPRLLDRTLLLKGNAKQNEFEVTGNLRSIKDGKIQEIYYYCNLCSIKSSVPGPCQCCREPVELVEKPAD